MTENSFIKDKEYHYYIDSSLVLTIKVEEDGIFFIENTNFKILSKIKNIENDYIVDLISHQKKDKLGRWRKNTKDIDNNIKWLIYILKEKGLLSGGNNKSVS